jgi:hypothetical protein
MNRLLLYKSIVVECLKGMLQGSRPHSLRRNGDSVDLLACRMLLRKTRVLTSDGVDIHRPLQCGGSSLNKYHSMPPKTESRGHIQPSQGQQKGLREQVSVAVAPHWDYCTDFAASPRWWRASRTNRLQAVRVRRAYYSRVYKKSGGATCARKQETLGNAEGIS